MRARARLRCEYCHALETWQYVEFTLEHVVPLAEGGESTLANLALACFACNRRKWDNRQGRDPETGRSSRLFNPRIDAWAEHFVWSAGGSEIIGVTPIGRATIATLDMNRERVVRIREADAAAGRHPPGDDPRR